MSKRKTIHRSVGEFAVQLMVRAAGDAALKRRKHICPIFRPKNAMEPELIGTGVFLAVGNRRFVLTASHVFGPHGAGHQELHIPNDQTGKLTELVGVYVRSKPEGGRDVDDLNDVGVVLLADTLAAQIEDDNFVRISSVDVDDIGNFHRPYLAMGYPWRVSPKANHRTKMVTASDRSYAADLLSHAELVKFGVRPDTHFLLRYAKRHSRTEFGRDITAPDPDGMSGGPLWRVEPLNSDGEQAFLVGIVIKWYRLQGGLLAIRMPVILAAIEQLCPDVAELIPRSRTLGIQVTSAPLNS